MTSVTCPEGLPPSRPKKNLFARFWYPTIVPMAPGGPWHQFPRSKCSKRWLGDPFEPIFDFWPIFAPKQCASLVNRDNFCVAQRQQCPCVAITQCPCVAITQWPCVAIRQCPCVAITQCPCAAPC